jgi:hypothetical protein
MHTDIRSHRLSLEEMDVIFGSEGTSQADTERMREIEHEIGLSAILGHESPAHQTQEIHLAKEKDGSDLA